MHRKAGRLLLFRYAVLIRNYSERLRQKDIGLRYYLDELRNRQLIFQYKLIQREFEIMLPIYLTVTYAAIYFL